MTFVDSNIARKNALQNAHLRTAKRLSGGAPIFSHIELSITGLCNRTCVFCPRADPQVYPNTNEHMPIELYRKVLNDLRDIDYTGGLSYSGFSEPLLHIGIVDFVSASRSVLPDCRVEIVTNGDKLTPALLATLFRVGLTKLLISMYDGPEQIPYYETIIAEAGVEPEKVILRKRYLPPEDGYGIMLTNRAGMVTLGNLGAGPMIQAMWHPCYYAHYRMMIDHKGDVLLCPHDWGKNVVVANVRDQHIARIWTGRTITRIRKRLGSGDRPLVPCKACDVDGTYQGGEHFAAWQEYYALDGVNS